MREIEDENIYVRLLIAIKERKVESFLFLFSVSRALPCRYKYPISISHLDLFLQSFPISGLMKITLNIIDAFKGIKYF